MNTLSNSLLLVAQAAPAGTQSGAGLMNILFIGFMFAAMWFLIIQPQRKKQKEHARMIEALTTGDEIVTAGGIYGEITAKRDDRYVVRIAEGVKIEVAKSFVHDVVRKDAVKK